MKKYLLFLSLFIFIGLTFYGCKKSTDDGLPVSNGFIQFKVDGMEYRFENYNTIVSTGTVTVSNASPPYNMLVTFDGQNNNTTYQHINLQQFSSLPIQVKNYVYNGSNYNERPAFTQQLTNLNRYLLTSKSTGNIQITHLDTIAGGTVTGTFNFTNLDYMDQYNVLISYPHTITDGSFSLVIGNK